MGTEGYPKVIKTVAVEGYDGLLLSVVVNLTGAEWAGLGASYDDATRAEFGRLLCKAYDGRRYEYGGNVLDFSTPEAALATLEAPELPLDLRIWVRNVPWEAINAYLEGLRGNFKVSFVPTST